jgi:hypothetical protein
MTTTATTSTVVFFGISVEDRFTWPGHPPWPVTDANQQPMDQSQPLAVRTNPKYYYKYLRLTDLSAKGEGWSRTFYMPPGTSTPIMLDRINDGDMGVAAWTLFFARPDNRDLQIKTYRVDDPSLLTRVSDSSLQRMDQGIGIQCRVDDYPEAHPDAVTTSAQWTMGLGSCLMDTGSHYYSITNTGTTAQYLVTIASFNAVDIRAVMASPVVRPLNLWVDLYSIGNNMPPV